MSSDDRGGRRAKDGLEHEEQQYFACYHGHHAKRVHAVHADTANLSLSVYARSVYTNTRKGHIKNNSRGWGMAENASNRADSFLSVSMKKTLINSWGRS